MRINTRGLHKSYDTAVRENNSALGLIRNAEILTTLDEVLDLFGEHPFHHVIEGRIASIVQTELGIKNNLSITTRVPEEFQKYATFEFHPWNNPHLHYRNIKDILKRGSLEFIPPDYKGGFVALYRSSLF